MLTADSLVQELQTSPEDPALRERAARALVHEGRAGDAVALLQQGLIHLNGHDPGALPCLCRRCIVPVESAVVVGGMTFQRDFVIAAGEPRGRVLFFWLPDELVPQIRRVRRSVGTGLRTRLSK